MNTQSVNLLMNPVANDPNCCFKYLQRYFINLRELNEQLTMGTEHVSVTNILMSRSKHLIQEIKLHLDKENTNPNPVNDSCFFAPSSQNTAKFASS
jgi:hypothetical protein